jgi:cytochrome d ubiquinol oxidase subunit I
MDHLLVGLSPLILARWQFGITTVFHFLFVPLTIGLVFLVAILETAAYKTKSAEYAQMAKFFGKLFLINFAIGVVTGIVQEFQFGMAWSRYSTFVGNIFGAPLAIEALLAFFMESTFIGLWIFGRGRLSPRVHLATIWMVSLGTTLSAAFIVAANSWMQHPVGYRIDKATGQAVMTNFWAVMTNSTFISAYLHVLFAAILTGAAFMLGVAAWHVRKGHYVEGFAKAMRIGVIVVLLSTLGTLFMGDNQARLMTTQQPMKMAAAEALYNTSEGASFSLLTIGNLSGAPVFQIRIPHALSLLATNQWNGKVQGINQIQAADEQLFGPGSYTPVLWVTYWTFRLMVGLGMLLLALGVIGLYLMRKGRLESTKWYLHFATWMIAAPFLANTFGWIFTEMGRQPWVVYGLMLTKSGVSPFGVGYVATSLVGFTALYSFLAVIEFSLMWKFARKGIDAPTETGDGDDETPAEDRPFELVY